MRFNLSDWALRHTSMIWYLILVSLLAGAFGYSQMGREEDPSFTVKTMIIQAALPGATAEETVTQVTERIEKKLQELENLKFTRSETKPGLATVYVELTAETKAPAVAATWQRVRNMMGDISHDFPKEFAGFAFNDSFGDVFGNIYAFTYDGYTPSEAKHWAETVQNAVLQLGDTGKADLVGTQDPVIYLEFSARKLASLGLDAAAVLNTLSSQNAIVPSGVIRTAGEKVTVRVSGSFTGAKELAATTLRVGDTFFVLSDVATVAAGYVDPAKALYRYNGQPAIALIVGMRAGANILHFGADLDHVMEQMAPSLPIGIDLHKVADQPTVVEESVNHFLRALVEAVVIVLGVSFVSLGVRAGLVVTMTIPLVLALTFVVLDMMGITLQRISLGALIIALGLLVDDAMISIETMISRLEVGESLQKAASAAWSSIAFPMLTGTLVTMSGFIPIGLNTSSAGEYTISLFYVIVIALLLSWVVAVLFAPILGYTFLPKTMKHHAAEPGRVRRVFHALLRGVMRAKWLTVAVTVAMFASSLYGLRFVESQFFPTSDRPELIIDITLRKNASFQATDAVMTNLDTWLTTRKEASYWSTYVGRPAPRFILAFDSVTPSDNFGQIVVMTPDLAARDALKAAVSDYAKTLPGVDLYAKFLELGPPVGKPVQYRLSGPDVNKVSDLGRDLSAVLASDARLGMITQNYNEPARVARVVLDQDKLRQLGVTQTDVAQALYTLFDGVTVTELRDGKTLIDVVARGSAGDRSSITSLQNLQLGNAAGQPIPLTSFASLEWALEQPLIQQRNRVPTVTVKAAVVTKDQPATITKDLQPAIDAFAATLPPGYGVEVAGSAESSAESQSPIIAVVPIMLLIMVTLVMIQMQSFRRSFIVLAVAPLGMIGVVGALLLSGAPLGFVAILGVLALVGILIRNSIILVHEIEELRAKGLAVWNAVFDATDSRARPILLTAAAASLALIPISRQVFWGPMAYAMIGGIIVGTLLTLLFVPALYCLVFRVKRP
jgi:multidrug efflux pump subunit AcrB